MMRTRTEWYRNVDEGVRTIVNMEESGWSVRQIIPVLDPVEMVRHTRYDSELIVVYEREV